MKKRLENLFWFTVENGPTILTIGFAAYIIALSQTTSISVEVMLSWVLTILGLLAISGLVERLRKLRTIEDISNKILQAVESKFGDRASADHFFMPRMPPIAPYLEKAVDIRFSGVALQRTIRENLDILTRRLKEGAELKMIIVEPNGKATQQIANPDANLSLEYLHANLQITIQNVKWLSSLPESKGSIELRFMDEDPNFNIIAIDPDKEYGVIFIEFYPQRWVRGSRPRMELNAKRDKYWFEYFKHQYERLWEDCKPAELGAD